MIDKNLRDTTITTEIASRGADLEELAARVEMQHRLGLYGDREGCEERIGETLDYPGTVVGIHPATTGLSMRNGTSHCTDITTHTTHFFITIQNPDPSLTIS
jgi:hypothetical protein